MDEHSVDRRAADAEFRRHLQDHLDRLDREMEDIREQQKVSAEQQKQLSDQLKLNTSAVTELTTILRASRMGTAIIKYVVGLGTAVIVAYAAYRGIK